MAYKYDPRDFADPRQQETIDEALKASAELKRINRYNFVSKAQKMLFADKITQAQYEQMITVK
jgi:hypothetical protein